MNMKAIVDTKSFVDSVMWATKNYDNKDERSYIVLTLDEDGNGHLSHTNQNSYMKSDFTISSITFDDDEKGKKSKFAVDGRFLSQLAKAIGTKGELTLSKKLNSEKTSLHVKTSSGQFTVPIVDARIPKAPKITEMGEVDDNEFFDTLLRISKLSDPANSGSNSFIGAVDLGFDKEKITMFATDRFTLGEVSLDFSPSEDNDNENIFSKHILLPAASASLVPPTKGINTSITLICENDTNEEMLRFGYSFPDGRIALFSLLNVDTFQHLPMMKKKSLEGVEYSVVVNTNELMNAIKVVSSLSWTEDNVYFHINEDDFIVSDSTGNNSLTVDHSDVKYDAEETYTTRFLRSIINSAFSPISTAKVRLKWGTDINCFIFSPLTENDEEVENVFVMAVIGKNKS